MFIFSDNPIVSHSMILQDYANPQVQPLIQMLPEITSTISESWHADKIVRETDPNQLAPMVARGSLHFFICELVQLKGGQIAFVLCFLMFEKRECAEVVYVNFDKQVASISFYCHIEL